jgi:hypothetical protein
MNFSRASLRNDVVDLKSVKFKVAVVTSAEALGLISSMSCDQE